MDSVKKKVRARNLAKLECACKIILYVEYLVFDVSGREFHYMKKCAADFAMNLFKSGILMELHKYIRAPSMSKKQKADFVGSIHFQISGVDNVELLKKIKCKLKRLVDATKVD